MVDPAGLPAQTSLADAPQVTLTGLVSRLVYTSPDGEFAVVRLEVEGQQVPISATGALAHLREGENVEVRGNYEVHPRFGQRLKVQSAIPLLPETLLGVERYLATLAGVGPETAKRLVALYEYRAIEVLTEETWKVAAARIKGLGKKRLQRAVADAHKRKEEREVMVFLQSQGISSAYAARIHKVYGAAAMAKVRENPYRLARDIPGIGFQIADRIARNMGIELNAPIRIEAGLLYTLERAADSGHCYFPLLELHRAASKELQMEPGEPKTTLAIEHALATLVSQSAIIIDNNDVALPRLSKAESVLAQRLLELQRSPRNHTIKIIVDQLQPRLAEGQIRALKMVEESPVVVITGGPGTGKTTIIRNLVRTFALSSKTVLLAAPTGRAAKRLAEATNTPASTVHRLLEWSPKEGFRRNHENPLAADLLVCDEASMLDLPLAKALASAVPKGATLVLVGDVDQLPSVGPGRVLFDIIDSSIFAVSRLHEIFRQAEGSDIVESAHRIRKGYLPEIGKKKPTTEGLPGDFHFVSAQDPKRAQEIIIKLVAERIPLRFGFSAVRDIQVLTPMHKGEVGTTELNQILQETLNPGTKDTPFLQARGRTFRKGDKVMQIRNDYEREVWNGDVGVIDTVDVEGGELLVRFDDDRQVDYGTEDLDQLELAYALSVHKSQGSEYPAVIVPLTMQHYVLLRRNLLYTAVTRGKKLVVLVGDLRALKHAVKEQGDLLRYTRLKERLLQNGC